MRAHMPMLDTESAIAPRERALERIRERAGEMAAHAVGEQTPGGPPVASAATGYYGLPLLKKPVWKSSVPLYLFAGGAAGAAALIALGARATRRDRLARDARWIAAGGAAVS